MSNNAVKCPLPNPPPQAGEGVTPSRFFTRKPKRYTQRLIIPNADPTRTRFARPPSPKTGRDKVAHPPLVHRNCYHHERRFFSLPVFGEGRVGSFPCVAAV